MNRRAFLKTLATTTLAGLAVIAFPAVRASAGAAPRASLKSTAFKRSFQGTRDGRLLESLDGGQTWRQIASFGSHCSIQAIRERRGVLYLEVGVRQYSFFLKSADANRWLTTGSIPLF